MIHINIYLVKGNIEDLNFVQMKVCVGNPIKP
jgi:hypothetical protein